MKYTYFARDLLRHYRSTDFIFIFLISYECDNGKHIFVVSSAFMYHFVFFLLVAIQNCSGLKSILTDWAGMSECVSEVFTLNVTDHGFSMIHDLFTERTLVDCFCSRALLVNYDIVFQVLPFINLVVRSHVMAGVKVLTFHHSPKIYISTFHGLLRLQGGIC